MLCDWVNCWLMTSTVLYVSCTVVVPMTMRVQRRSIAFYPIQNMSRGIYPFLPCYIFQEIHSTSSLSWMNGGYGATHTQMMIICQCTRECTLTGWDMDMTWLGRDANKHSEISWWTSQWKCQRDTNKNVFTSSHTHAFVIITHSE